MRETCTMAGAGDMLSGSWLPLPHVCMKIFGLLFYRCKNLKLFDKIYKQFGNLNTRVLFVIFC